MRKFMVMAGLVVVAVACSSGADMLGEILDAGVPDAGAQPGTGGDMKFVGFSNGTARGDGGIFAMYAACRADFGSDHRMCTLSEILNTVNTPDGLPEGNSWYQSTLASTDCRGWSSDGTSQSPISGPTVNEIGKFLSVNCGATLPIACCGPK